MMVGIRAHDLATGDISHVLSKAETHGFKAIQLVFKKALGKPFDDLSCLEVKNALNYSNVRIAMLGAYFNPVHSNKKLVQENVEYFEKHLSLASKLNCNYVGTETGSYNDDKWTYNPKNQTEEGYQETMLIFKRLVQTASKYKTTILMEPAWGHVIYSVEQLKRAYDEINSPYLKVTIDLYNLLYIGNYKEYKNIFLKALETFKENIKIIHLKDFYIENEKIIQCGLGKGIIDFKFIVDNIKRFCPSATMIFEGVVGDDILSSKDMIDELNK